MAQKVKNLSAMPGVQKIPWRRKWQPLLAFVPGELHGQRTSLAGTIPEITKSQTQLRDQHFHFLQ